MPKIMNTKQGLPILAFASQPEWEAWQDGQHATSKGLWLKIAKKDSGLDSVTYAEALESALCYGWIDGQKGSLDERAWLQKFTPRGPKSVWSRINRDKANGLQRQGRLKPPGLAQVERAQRDGRWDAAYESQSRATVPDDLQRALEDTPVAQSFFATLNSVNRYAILYRIQSARKPETRARRIEQFVAMLAEHKTLHP
jgi:uncharacterized protein YdeI (YjbR/CyaY-like superfamily)